MNPEGPKRQGDRGKGWFGRSGLQVAKAYVNPPPRKRMLWAGILVAAVLVGLLAADFGFREAQWVSNGPLSSAHARLENDCSSCHDPLSRQVTVENCTRCHERHGDELGVYSFSSHYLYRTEDFQRVAVQDGEVSCFSCHPEHNGRQALRTVVEDRLCITCHDEGSFIAGHPEFEVLRDAIPDRPGIAFPHVRHVRELLAENEFLELEQTCLTCHNPEDDGMGFRAIEFDRHCDSCHLTRGVATARMAITDGESVGVEDLATIRAQGRPGTEWSQFLSPAEFREAGGRLIKTPLYHEDPWVLYNLRRLRGELYEDGGIAELLVVSPEAPPAQVREVYREAVTTLERYVLGLRGRPEPAIRQELEKVEELLDTLRRRLEDPHTTLDESGLLLALQQPKEGVSAERRQEIESLVEELTQACAVCHQVDRATITRVQRSQKTYLRADFDHRSHILETNCLDCHAQIPIAEAVADLSLPLPPEDRSSVQNLPGIETCRTCHTPDLAADSCTTCHAFHPDLSRRSELLHYVD